MKLSLVFTLAMVQSIAAEQVLNAFGQPSYGVDVSFPVHYGNVLSSDDPNQPLGERQALYDDFMKGCHDFYGKRGHSCDVTEQDRWDMSLRQPASMQNYTDTGFKKVRAPERVFELLSTHWKNNQEKKEKESWPTGNTYVNYWKAPTYMVNVEDNTLRGAGYNLKRKIWEGVKPILEEWTGMELEPSSMYGVREYTRGAILAPHADRMPLISSCIINVAQDVEEDWPLEVFGRDGLAYNVTMQPGDMVLYESHSLIHGRPFPLKGNYFANIFIHFRPTGKLIRERETPVLTDAGSEEMPIYILRGSPEGRKWMQEHGHVVESPAAAPLSEVAQAAAVGDMDLLSFYATSQKDLLHRKDHNGWKPIHEAARGGHKEAIELLVKYGADVNDRAGNNGPSVLSLVVQNHGHDHPLVEYLRELGAEEMDDEF
jgi:hypothetical protein